MANFEIVWHTRELTERVGVRRADLGKLMAEWEKVPQALEFGG